MFVYLKKSYVGILGVMSNIEGAWVGVVIKIIVGWVKLIWLLWPINQIILISFYINLSHNSPESKYVPIH